MVGEIVTGLIVRAFGRGNVLPGMAEYADDFSRMAA